MDRYSTPCFGTEIKRCPSPTVWLVCVKVSIQQIFIFVELLPHLSPFPGAANFRQQIVLLHDPQYSFGVTVDILPLEPQPHPAVAKVPKLRSRCSEMISARAASFSALPRRWTKS